MVSRATVLIPQMCCDYVGIKLEYFTRIVAFNNNGLTYILESDVILFNSD